MKPLLFLAVLAASSSAPERPAREALMDEIERQVRLPIDARPLGEYGRYYFFEGEGRVKAVYRWAQPKAAGPNPRGWGCEEGVLLEGVPTTRAVPCPRDAGALSYLRAGQRRWVADRKAVPFVYDGGCVMVHVVFDLKTRKIEHVACNGLG